MLHGPACEHRCWDARRSRAPPHPVRRGLPGTRRGRRGRGCVRWSRQRVRGVAVSLVRRVRFALHVSCFWLFWEDRHRVSNHRVSQSFRQGRAAPIVRPAAGRGARASEATWGRPHQKRRRPPAKDRQTRGRAGRRTQFRKGPGAARGPRRRPRNRGSRVARVSARGTVLSFGRTFMAAAGARGARLPAGGEGLPGVRPPGGRRGAAASGAPGGAGTGAAGSQPLDDGLQPVGHLCHGRPR